MGVTLMILFAACAVIAIGFEIYISTRDDDYDDFGV